MAFSISSGFSTEHPHVCGERQLAQVKRPRPAGTSPRVWGKGAEATDESVQERNIPTCVGKGRRRSLSSRRSPEHPHVCGERGVYRRVRGGVYGTSPRVWGKGDLRVLAPHPIRNIPTCVGKGNADNHIRCVSPEHPHVCGERKTFGEEGVRADGTSPRVWGKGRCLPPARHPNRNIPTCVGKGRVAGCRSSPCSEHPHVCGERTAARLKLKEIDGTSPRVWGKDDKRKIHPVELKEHPHVCGER